MIFCIIIHSSVGLSSSRFISAEFSSVFCFQTERDVSVRQRAVDLLYAMCDRSNAEEIVSEMLNYLETADYSIREEMVSFFCVVNSCHVIK